MFWGVNFVVTHAIQIEYMSKQVWMQHHVYTYILHKHINIRLEGLIYPLFIFG